MSGPVRLVAAGGTIAMDGPSAVPMLDATALLDGLPGVDLGGRVEIFTLKPSVYLTLPEALALVHRVRDIASGGESVVVTHGTDFLEETAMLCDLVYGGDPPVVFTGAMRPASAPGADGPANLRDAIVAAGHPRAAGLGVLVCFAGQLHAACAVRKAASTGPAAFESPLTGPIGYVHEDRVWLGTRPRRQPVLDVGHLDASVEIVPIGLGSSGRLIDVAAPQVDGLVVPLPGAGHVSPLVLSALERAVDGIPVVAVARPTRGALLRDTYGFEGCERDVRAAGVVCAGALGAPAARMKLMAALGAGLDREQIAVAFAGDDL